MDLLMLGKKFILTGFSCTRIDFSQESWIQQMSFRNNILFGKVYNEHWYQKVIEACALDNDIKVNGG